MAVNEQGYLRPSYEELLEGRIEQAQELFGDDIDVSDASPLGKFIRLAVQDLADAYEAQEIIYYSRFPHTATGQSLDRLMPFAGISRNPATRAEHEITFSGTAEYEVPVGFLVGTTGDEEFYLVNAVTLDENGSGVGVVQCTELGTVGNVQLGSITEIVNPDADVESISHTRICMIADDEETDEKLRERFEIAIEGAGSGTLSAIRGAVMRVSGVTGCLIIENDTDETVDDRPPHSFEVFVYAPESLDKEIAQAILEKKPIGIPSCGEVSVEVDDASGGTQIINFSRVIETVIYVHLVIQTDDSFEVDGVEQIKAAVTKYVNGLDIGDDVVYTALYKYIYGVTGVVDVTDLSLSIDGSTYTTGNIQMDENDAARTSEANVEVVTVDDSN